MLKKCLGIPKVFLKTVVKNKKKVYNETIERNQKKGFLRVVLKRFLQSGIAR